MTGSSQAPGTLTTRMFSSRQPCLASTSNAPRVSSSVMNSLKRLTTTPMRRFVASREPCSVRMDIKRSSVRRGGKRSRYGIIQFYPLSLPHLDPALSAISLSLRTSITANRRWPIACSKYTGALSAARNDGAGARHHGPGARARHHHQGSRRAAELPGRRRQISTSST